MLYLSGRQSKLSAPRRCGSPDELSPEAEFAEGESSSGSPQHRGVDNFGCRPERYDIEVLLPHSYFKGTVFF